MTKAWNILKDFAPSLFVVWGCVESFFGIFDRATYFTALACACLLMDMKADD